MEEIYEDYLEDVIEIAESHYDIAKEEIVYNHEHFERCFEEGISADDAVFQLSNFCI